MICILETNSSISLGEILGTINTEGILKIKKEKKLNIVSRNPDNLAIQLYFLFWAF